MELPKEKDTNSSLQADEIEALSSIFEEKFQLDKENAFTIKICSICDKEVYLQITLPENYPLHSPPVCHLSAPWMSRQTKLELSNKLEEICRKNIGESNIYLCVEEIKSFLENQVKYELENEKISKNSTEDVDICPRLEEFPFNEDADLPVIEHGEPILDRRSVFQAHLAKIVSENQVKLVLDKLKENSKISSATHNVYAYRILLKNGRFTQDCNDDGEARAGSVLLHLLQVSDLSNILIVVSRWFGGIHLGSERFKHYSTAASNLISQIGFIRKEKKLPSAKKK